MKRFVLVCAFVLLPIRLFAQTSGAQGDTAPATPPGHELTFSLGGYNYVEPGDTRISIHGIKFGGDYLGTFVLNERRHWFAQAGLRGNIGTTDYDGFCAPWFITPDRFSPNGYFLNLGEYSPCEDDGNQDWYVEGRGIIGKDFVRHEWTFSPHTGLGLRHLSNALDDIKGFRTENYLYLPVGVTARTAVGAEGALSFNFEYDHLLRGRQKTINSALGGGVVPATAIAPAFTIDGFEDVAFEQHQGFGIRGSAKYEINRHWSLQPYWTLLGRGRLDDQPGERDVHGQRRDGGRAVFRPRAEQLDQRVRDQVRRAISIASIRLALKALSSRARLR